MLNNDVNMRSRILALLCGELPRSPSSRPEQHSLQLFHTVRGARYPQRVSCFTSNSEIIQNIRTRCNDPLMKEMIDDVARPLLHGFAEHLQKKAYISFGLSCASEKCQKRVNLKIHKPGLRSWMNPQTTVII